MPVSVPPVLEPGGLNRHDQPTLAVDELVVRSWRAADAPAVVSAYRNSGIQRWHVRTMSEEEAVEWVRSWSDRWSMETDASWAIADTGGLVGRVGFRVLDLVNGCGEVTYWVVPAARGRNIAARSLVAVTDWMFDHVGFHRMALLHSTQNEPSCRVAAKASYAYEGTGRRQGLHADGWHDMHQHARVRDAPR